MALIKVTIQDDGEHWDKRISVFGIAVYHRHDFTKETEEKSRCIGFNAAASVFCDADDKDYYPEEKKQK